MTNLASLFFNISWHIRKSSLGIKRIIAKEKKEGQFFRNSLKNIGL